ncbi:Nucleolar protein 16 [Scheffersomyces spartinae]|uniref:Nucleolar protein 16 n=1 Tax=Scheffersomyces spartinae TaxID=45513 RepID=A0A9P7V8T4_9ASCO|nr:Nucleolar protein 16 [Scheffersomyces spartinae]KAG7193413.1 Nucleolar protein 16 [Scheffersomyces spartinae]
MTSVRKRKMKRSSVRKNTRRVKDKHDNINIHSNPIIAKHWDKSLTLQQNYKKLGLRTKLGSMAGGIEKDVLTLTQIKQRKEDDTKVSVEDIENTDDPAKIPEGEARIIRNEESGEVLKVIYGTMKVKHTSAAEVEKSEVIQQLEEYAKKNSQIRRERKQSEREDSWLKDLYEKHGDDYEKMKWDKKLNVFQQSAGDLRKRITKWKKVNNIE